MARTTTDLPLRQPDHSTGAAAGRPGLLWSAGLPRRPLRSRPMASGRRTILMVEDEAAITEPLSEALAREGWDSAVAGTAADGLELAEQLQPGAGAAGRDAARRLRLRRVPRAAAPLGGPDHHALRARGGDRPDRRPRGRRGRLRREAVQRARARGARARRAAAHAARAGGRGGAARGRRPAPRPGAARGQPEASRST